MRRRTLISGLVVTPVVFVLLIGIWGGTWREARFDLTQNSIYTMSEGSKLILAGLEEEVTLNIYFSAQASEELPALRAFATRVGQLIAEMATHSKGKLVVKWFDPVPFSDEEDRAILVGLTALPLGVRASDIYFGIVLRTMDGREEVLRFISPQREHLLEYEIIQRIDQVTRDHRPRLGVLSSLPLQNLVVYEQLEARYDLVEIPVTAQDLPSALDLLVLVQPPSMSDAFHEALRSAVEDDLPILLLVDPLIQSLATPAQPTSGADEVLSLLNLGLKPEVFVADRLLGLQVTVEPTAPPIRHPAIIGLSSDVLNNDDPVTSALDAINAATVGVITLAASEGSFNDVLWRSSEASAVLPISRLLSDQPIEEAIVQLFEEIGSGAGDVYPIAVRVREPTEAIVVADVDFLFDRYWVNQQNFMGTTLLEPFAANGSFVLNAVDNLTGDPALIGLRSREPSLRLFTLLDEMRRRAETRLLGAEQALESALAQANAQLANLRGISAEDLTDQQRLDLQASLETRLELRQQLREVRRDLDRDIDDLRRRLIWINVVIFPIAVGSLLALSGRRRERFKQTQRL